MHVDPEDYFVYLAAARQRAAPGCAVTAAGFTRIPAGSPYPPRRHPLDHHFSWSEGRVLNAFQIVYITDGLGTFEADGVSGRQRIGPGTVFLLVPGVWHRYAPDPAVGWTEHWVECDGAAVAAARRRGTIDPRNPLIGIGFDPDLLDTFRLCHRWARRACGARGPALSALVMHILAVLENARTAGPKTNADTVVGQAQRAIMERFHQPIDLPQLAQDLNVSYSHLRQTFKARMGMSMKQYQLQLRLQRVQELLARTDRSVKEIADMLGFASAYHLSLQFKSRFGQAPTRWRTRAAGARPDPRTNP